MSRLVARTFYRQTFSRPIEELCLTSREDGGSWPLCSLCLCFPGLEQATCLGAGAASQLETADHHRQRRRRRRLGIDVSRDERTITCARRTFLLQPFQKSPGKARRRGRRHRRRHVHRVEHARSAPRHPKVAVRGHVGDGGLPDVSRRPQPAQRTAGASPHSLTHGRGRP